MVTTAARPMPDVAPDRFRMLAEALVSATDVARTLFDEAGRPLGERYFPPSFRGGASFQMTSCPYPGSRHGRAMNVSALPGVVRHWEPVLAGLAALRAQYLDQRNPGAVTWTDIWFLGRIATAVPAYLARAPHEARPTVPAAVAALFKPAIGLYMVAERAFLLGADPGAVLTEEAVCEALHRTGALLSGDAACSAPPRLVRELIGVALNAADGGRSGDETARAALGGVSAGRLVRYGTAVARLELAKFIYFVEAGCRLDRLDTDGLLRRPPYRPPRDLRGIPAEAWQLEALQRRLTTLGRQTGLPLPDGLPVPAPGGRGSRLDHEVARDHAWLVSLSGLQEEVLAGLGCDQSAPLTMEDLGRIGAYLAFDWRYARAGLRFLVHRQLEVP